mmetsp:Transcript_10285/g.30953  ORF Transcript_10285/g.30953 Transcript_10285/m.30953 type:complete len:287 (+) Transcript_10285:146-1006(+)
MGAPEGCQSGPGRLARSTGGARCPRDRHKQVRQPVRDVVGRRGCSCLKTQHCCMQSHTAARTVRLAISQAVLPAAALETVGGHPVLHGSHVAGTCGGGGGGRGGPQESRQRGGRHVGNLHLRVAQHALRQVQQALAFLGRQQEHVAEPEVLRPTQRGAPCRPQRGPGAALHHVSRPGGGGGGGQGQVLQHRQRCLAGQLQPLQLRKLQLLQLKQWRQKRQQVVAKQRALPTVQSFLQERQCESQPLRSFRYLVLPTDPLVHSNDPLILSDEPVLRPCKCRPVSLLH